MGLAGVAISLFLLGVGAVWFGPATIKTTDRPPDPTTGCVWFLGADPDTGADGEAADGYATVRIRGRSPRHSVISQPGQETVVTAWPARRHSSIPSVRRAARRPWAVSSRTASWAKTQ